MSRRRYRITRLTRAEKPSTPFRVPLIILGVLVVAAVVLGIVYLANKSSAPTAETLPAAVTLNEAWSMYQSKAIFIDVRPSNAWKAYHITNSKSIPLDQLSSGVDQLPQHTDLVVVDEQGELSSQGRDILLKAGFTRVTVLSGGIEQWILNGLPFEGNFPY